MHLSIWASRLLAAFSALGLAALMGCAGRNLYSVPGITGFSPASAEVGSTVIIQGTGFKGISEVSFGGQQAVSFHVDSGNQISAVLPQAAITGQITVLNPEGLGNSYNSFIVTPVITGIDPTFGPAGTAVTVTGSGLYGTTSVAIGGETPGQPGASTFTYNDPNTVTVMVGTATPTGPLVITVNGLQATGPTFTVN